MSGSTRKHDRERYTLIDPLLIWEVPLLPPLVRFFVGLLLVLAWAGGSLLFIYWISTMYGKDE